MEYVLEVIFQFGYLSLSAIFIVAVFWGTLRMLDKAHGIDFKKEFRELANNEIALAIYFVGRLIALALLFAPLLRVIL